MRVGRFVAVLFILAGVVFPAGGAWSQEAIKVAVVTRPGAAQNVCADQFEQLVESRSSYMVDVFDSESLGTEREILKQIQKGAIHIGIVTSGPFDEFVPEARVVDYPYLFDSYEQADVVLDGPAGAELLARLEKGGFKGLAFAENGFRHLTNSKRPVHKVKDVKGLRIRVMESFFHEALWRLFGAQAVPIGSLDAVAKDLQSGLIDGEENPLSAIWANQFYKGQKYLALTGHVYSSHIAVANLKWFEALPENDRKLISRAMGEAARFQKHWSRGGEFVFLKRIKAAGLEVDETPDVASFRKRAATMADHELFKPKEVADLLQKFKQAAEAARK